MYIWDSSKLSKLWRQSILEYPKPKYISRAVPIIELGDLMQRLPGQLRPVVAPLRQPPDQDSLYGTRASYKNQIKYFGVKHTGGQDGNLVQVKVWLRGGGKAENYRV
jgi:hypothetical protein